uniref:Uncharacterized mitochondrial protein AtMg00810-like n=1 Tax=Nicotiana tabacum TaxID=4097 RepID=A0A1S4B1F2_TOBAC|nr:PREDICTED: uncharacterized mitochondrial protein AtMg00810-like [Nicotiana tabacum]
MHKRKYTLELISEVGLSAAKPAATPIDTNIKLTSTQYDKVNTKSQAEEDSLVDQATYQKLIGNSNSKSVSQQPKQSNMTTTLRIVRYIKNQPGQGILLSSKNNNVVIAYCDADWAACPITRRTVIGFLIEIGDLLVSWKSKKHTTISRSSAEAEYRSLAITVAELIWLIGVLKEVETDINLPVEIHSNSKAAIQIAANPVYHETN